MKSLREQTEEKIEQGRKGNPDFMQGVDDAIKKAKSFQEGKDAIKLGQKVSGFKLPNQTGKSVELTDLLKKGPVVVTFYRGSWCPYCNLQLNALQSRLAEIHELGAELVAISPEIPDGSMTQTEIDQLAFVVLSDQDAKVASQFGVAWHVPEFLTDHMRVDRNLDLDTINNGNGSVLPIPATFVIDRDGTVTWRYVDVDYRTRAEPEDIIEALNKLS